MTSKSEVKPQPRYFYLWRRINTFDEQRTLDAYSIMHMITPASHAKLVCISQKFQYIIGSIYYPPTTTSVSPLFQFLVFRQFLLEYISPDYRKTDLLALMIEQLTKGMNRVREQSKIKHITDVANKIFKQFYSIDEKQEWQQKLRSGDRVQRLAYLKEVQSKRMEDHIMIYKQIQTEKGVLGSEQYIRSQFQQVRNIQLLTFSQQYTRWRNFQTFHKKTLSCCFVEDKRNRPYVYSLKINRPSTEIEPILMRLSDHVQLRSQWTDYGPQNQVFIKDLLQQLKKYHLDSSIFDQEKPEFNFYAHTSPQYVLFDQITLRPKLSYEPLLVQLFGLTKRPTSSECKIVWFCTPKEFDYFQGEDELQPLDKNKIDMRLALNDPFYGNDSLYSRPVTAEVIQKQKKQLQNARESICVDRFLLTSYYLREGKEFGRPQKRVSYGQIQHHFKVQLKRVKQKIHNDASNLQYFLGKLAQGASGQFNFKFSELVQNLSIDQDDSVLQAQRYVKVVRYLNMRYTLIREIVNVITNERLFNKMSNAKKYIIFCFALGLQVLEELRLTCIEGGRTGDIPTFRKHIEQNGKKMKNGKSAYHWLESNFAKVEEYRSKASNANNKFLLQAQGIKLLDCIKKLNETIHHEYKNMDDICEKLEEQTKNARQQAKEKLIKTKNILNNSITDVTNTLSDFCKRQFNSKHPSGPHKLPDDKNQDTEQLYKMITKKFDLTIQALFTSSPENFIIYDSMLMRLLHPEEADHLQSLINAKPPLLRDLLRKEREGLNTAAADIIAASIKKIQIPQEKSKKNQIPEENIKKIRIPC